jgi:hypothetical protein
MDARYRTDYPGEFVITNSRWAGGKKEETREWIANPIENHHISGRAACIGHTAEKQYFDYTRLQRHRGGLLGSKKLQTYGVGDIAQEMRLDFTIETRQEQLAELVESGYSENNIVYTDARNCITNPGKFYLIPQKPKLLDLVMIMYLSAFDGHSEIFMLGYHKETDAGNPGWINQVCEVIRAYSGTQFVFAGEPTNMPDVWLDLPNARAISYRDFIGYCDI